jgi:hypothetical protein
MWWSNPALLAGTRPTPTQEENDNFALAQSTGSLPPYLPWVHLSDLSAVDPQSYDPTPAPSDPPTTFAPS